MLPAIRGPVVFHASYYSGFSRLTGGTPCAVFRTRVFIPESFLFLFLLNIFSCYTVSHICCWGGGAGFLADGWEGGPALSFSGFFRVACLSGVTLVN